MSFDDCLIIDIWNIICSNLQRNDIKNLRLVSNGIENVVGLCSTNKLLKYITLNTKPQLFIKYPKYYEKRNQKVNVVSSDIHIFNIIEEIQCSQITIKSVEKTNYNIGIAFSAKSTHDRNKSSGISIGGSITIEFYNIRVVLPLSRNNIQTVRTTDSNIYIVMSYEIIFKLR